MALGLRGRVQTSETLQPAHLPGDCRSPQTRSGLWRWLAALLPAQVASVGGKWPLALLFK